MSTSNTVATGGTVKRIGLTGHLTHTFTESGDFTVHRPVLVRYLVVGGRGGGPAPDDKSKINQEGGIGEVVDGTTTYKLQPGTYKVTVGPRSTTFTEKEIAGVGMNTGTCYTQIASSVGTLCHNLNHQQAWTGNQRTFAMGNPSSIGTMVSAKGGPPHPGIWTRPTQHRQSGRFANVRMNSTTGRSGESSNWTTWDGRDGSDGRPLSCIVGPATWNSYHRYWNSPLHCADSSSGVSTKYTMNPHERIWSSVGNPTVSNQKESDIDGTSKKYGLTPLVIIRYDETTAGVPAPVTPSPDALAEIEKAYAEKLQKLKDAAEAEKKALQDQNAAAVAEAQKAQQQLITELSGLKQQYDQLKSTVADTTGQLEAAKTELSQIKTEYASKMAELKDAQKAELDALNSKNATALEAARLAQQQLISEMTTLKTQYDSLLANSSACPTIPEGSIVIDAKDGQLYKYDMAQLRPMSNDTYRTIGSPAYTTYPAGSLDKCPRGPVYTVQPTTTESPATTGPSGPPVFDGSLFIVVHGKSWTERGELKVVTTRFGGATLESFKFKDFAQVFLINNDGFIRNLADRGLYLTSKTGCLATGMVVDAPGAGWTFKKSAGSKYAYGLVSKCGSALSAAVGAREPVLEKTGDDWFIIPVGKATVS